MATAATFEAPTTWTADTGRAAWQLRGSVIACVAPGWIHRSVNVCHDRFVTVFSHPADHSQDDEVIERAGGDDGWRSGPDERYVGR